MCMKGVRGPGFKSRQSQKVKFSWICRISNWVNYNSLGVIKWYCKVGFALPFNFIRSLISALWACTKTAIFSSSTHLPLSIWFLNDPMDEMTTKLLKIVIMYLFCSNVMGWRKTRTFSKTGFRVRPGFSYWRTRVFIWENPGFRVPSLFTIVSDNQLYTSRFEQIEPMAGSKLVGLTVFEALKSYSK